MLFPGMDVVALVIMTSLLVSASRRSAPEDTVPPFWMSPIILSCSLFPDPVPESAQSSGASSCPSLPRLLDIGQRTMTATADRLKLDLDMTSL